MTYGSESLGGLTRLLQWRLDEPSGTSVADGTGNGRTGTAANGLVRGVASPITADPSSLAVEFDGVNDSVTSSYNPFSNAARRTYEGWAYRTDHATNDAIFADAFGLVLFRLIGGGTVQWYPNTNDVVIQWTTWPGDAQWVYWVLFHDPVSASKVSKLWLNGVFQSSKPSVNYNTGASSLELGTGGDPFKGRQDEFCVYDGEPTDADVLARYLSAFAVVVTGSQATESDTGQAGSPAIAITGTTAVETETAFVEGTPPVAELSAWIGLRETQVAPSPIVYGTQATETDTGLPIRTILGRMATEIDLGYVGSNLPQLDYGPDIRDWMKLTTGSGGQIPGGVAYLPWRPDPPHPDAYYGGDIGTLPGSLYSHALDVSKPRDGYLVLESFEGPGSVNVDLSPTAGGSSLSDGSKGGGLGGGSLNSSAGIGDYRIIFDGINFENGMIRFGGGRRVRMWYCNNTYPITVWLDQFNAACVAAGVPVVWPIPNTAQYLNVRNDVYGYYMKGNFVPSGFRLDNGLGNWRCSEMRLYGCDVHNVGDDAIFLGGAQTGVELRGVKTWDVNNYGWPAAGNPDWFHSNGIQFIGGEYKVTVEYMLVGGDIQLATEAGPIDYLTLDDIWQCQSGGVGMALDARYTRNFGDHCHIGGDRPYKWFGNGQSTGGSLGSFPTPPSYGGSVWDLPVYVYGDPSNLPRVFVQAWPTGVAPIADGAGRVGIIPGGPDMPLVVDHVDNPANIWRAAHPRDTRDVLLAGSYN